MHLFYFLANKRMFLFEPKLFLFTEFILQCLRYCLHADIDQFLGIQTLFNDSLLDIILETLHVLVCNDQSKNIVQFFKFFKIGGKPLIRAATVCIFVGDGTQIFQMAATFEDFTFSRHYTRYHLIVHLMSQIWRLSQFFC